MSQIAVALTANLSYDLSKLFLKLLLLYLDWTFPYRNQLLNITFDKCEIKKHLRFCKATNVSLPNNIGS